MSDWTAAAARSAVIVPAKGGIDSLAECLGAVVPDLPAGTRLLLVDDGNHPPLADERALAQWLAHPAVVVLRLERNAGPGAARNRALRWCCDHDVATAVLLDADTIADPNFVQSHLDAHHRHPDVAVVGGAIRGRGRGLWARLDGAMSWFTSMPGSAPRRVEPPLHLPTTNMSFKLTDRTRELLHFREELRTGEDVELVNRLRRAGEAIHFDPGPTVEHQDRDTLGDFLVHQYRWGRHTFFVRVKQSTRWKRLGFAAAVPLLAPAFAAYATWLNLRPWLTEHPSDVALSPLVYATYLLKTVAMVEGALFPGRALR